MCRNTVYCLYPLAVSVSQNTWCLTHTAQVNTWFLIARRALNKRGDRMSDLPRVTYNCNGPNTWKSEVYDGCHLLEVRAPVKLKHQTWKTNKNQWLLQLWRLLGQFEQRQSPVASMSAGAHLKSSSFRAQMSTSGRCWSPEGSDTWHAVFLWFCICNKAIQHIVSWFFWFLWQVCDPLGDISLPADRDYTCDALRLRKVDTNWAFRLLRISRFAAPYRIVIQCILQVHDFKSWMMVMSTWL